MTAPNWSSPGTAVQARDWTVYFDEDGAPWAIFIHGHADLRTIKSNACRAEIKDAFAEAGGDDDDYPFGNLNIGHWWIRDALEAGDEDANPDCPWHFCHKADTGAIPITGVNF